MLPVEKVTPQFWPGVPVIPQMETDGAPTALARPYVGGGVFLDIDDIRAHGRDERILVRSFYDGVEYIYALVREVGAGR